MELLDADAGGVKRGPGTAPNTRPGLPKLLSTRKGWARAVMGEAFQGMGEARRPGMESFITSRIH